MRTHIYLLVLAVLWSSLSFHAASAALVDPVWQRAQSALDASKALVADEVGTGMEMIDGEGKSLGTMNIVEKISEWKDGEPVRTIVSNDNPQYTDVARTRFKISVPNHPEEALRNGTGPQRIGTEIVDGKSCVVFRVDGNSGKKTFRSKIWVDEASGLPLKAVHDFSGIPMTKSLSESITFGRGRDGAWVPESLVVDATVHMLFQSLRVVSKYQFRTWVLRPASEH